MTVIILERVTPGLRGELSRWLIEPKAGVFIGRISALVREKLWERVNRKLGSAGAAVLCWQTNNEQGFDIEMVGDRSRVVVDFDGLKLIRKVKKEMVESKNEQE